METKPRDLPTWWKRRLKTSDKRPKMAFEVPTIESIDRIFRNFNSGTESVLLQYWACTTTNSEDIGCNLMLTDQTFMSTRDEGLEEYRRICLESRYRFVELETRVGNWLPGRAAQTRIADHRTIHHVLNHEDRHSADVGSMGQLVLPVFHDQGAGSQLVGIIEYVTPVPKESYVEDFDQIHNLLKVPVVELIDRTFKKFNFGNRSGLLQFWACVPSSSEDIGYNLVLTDQTYILTRDHEGVLQDYRKTCLENHYPFVGLGTRVGNWLAGRAAQTWIADHRTMHHVPNQEDQHSADIGGMGQLVLPVFYDQGAGNKLVGVIELVTTVPKESYVEDFEHIHDLLKNENLATSYMGKMIRVVYNDDVIKFTLPLSAEFKYLHREVTKRFTELEDQKFCVEYDDTEGNRLPISSDEDLRVCMTESSSKGAKFIRMCVLLSA